MNQIIRCIFLLCLVGLAFPVSAQTLEEVSFGAGTNTYLTGINNAGFICGYYDSASATMGFVINPNGKIIRSNYTTAYSTKFMKINDHNVLLVNKTTGSTIESDKAYYDSTTESIPGGFVAMSNNQQPGLAQPFGLNNNNDFSGWYQGSTYRFLWVNHDSVPASPQWVFDKYLTYNTIGTAINDNGKTTGFYINGSTYGPFIYDVPTNTFTILNTAFHMQPYGINNSNAICGSFQQTAGYNTAFWGPVNNGIVTIHALNTLWQNPNTQSIANGINDKNEIVGDYVHPVSGNYIGFIYRPNTNEYRLPGFNFSTMTWKMVNTTAFPANNTAIWTPNFTNSLDYTIRDPFNTSAPPVIDSFLEAVLSPQFCYQPNLRNTCADWRSFAKEVDANNILGTPTNYEAWKHTQYYKLVTTSAYGPKFGGTCYGFAYTSLMKYIGDSLLLNRFGIPLGTNLGTVPNTDSVAITAVVRAYLKQYDPTIKRYLPSHKNEVLPWSGLYRLKNCYLDTMTSRRNPRAVYMMEVDQNNVTDTEWHEVLPYKIRTPRMFPFDNGATIAYDTMYVYDSNYPGDSNQHYTITSNNLLAYLDEAENPAYPTFAQLCFNEVGIREIMPVFHSALKQTSYPADTVLDLSMPANHYYTITGSGNTHIAYTGHTPANNIPYLTTVSQKDSVVKPKYYETDTVHSVAVTSYNYTDSAMLWNINDKHHIIGITRSAKPSESDNGTWKGRTMSYGTHDAVTKQLNGYLMEQDDDPNKGVNILASGLTMNAGDSILTENPSHFVYKITRFGSTNDKYDLWIYMEGADSLRQFRMHDIPIDGNTSHTIVPYYGPTGKTVVILVDAGNNGTIDSMITLTQTSLGIVNTRLPNGQVSIYPNPAHNMLTVAWKSDIPQGSSIIISDIAGRIVANKSTGGAAHSMTIPVNDLPAGAYIIRMMDENGNMLYGDKFVKE